MAARRALLGGAALALIAFGFKFAPPAWANSLQVEEAAGTPRDLDNARWQAHQHHGPRGARPHSHVLGRVVRPSRQELPLLSAYAARALRRRFIGTGIHPGCAGGFAQGTGGSAVVVFSRSVCWQNPVCPATGEYGESQWMLRYDRQGRCRRQRLEGQGRGLSSRAFGSHRDAATQALAGSLDPSFKRLPQSSD